MATGRGVSYKEPLGARKVRLTTYNKTDIKSSPERQRLLLFLASTSRDLADLPERVKEEFLTALTVVRLGSTPTSAKARKGGGAGVFELVEDFNKDTYRCVYTVRFEKAVYVLQVFQKKSKQGKKTPLADVRLVGSMLQRRDRTMKRDSQKKSAEDTVVVAGENLFADFGVPEASEKNAKVQLAVAINAILAKKSLGTQQTIAGRLGAKQPEVSALRNYKLKIFSLERLVEFLVALDNDVEITIKPARAKAGRTRVINRAA